MFVIILTVVFNFVFVPQYLLPWPLGHHAVFTLAMLRTYGRVSQLHIVQHYFTMLAIYASFAHHTLITSNSITCRTAFYKLFWTKSFWRYRDLLWYRWFHLHNFRAERRTSYVIIMILPYHIRRFKRHATHSLAIDIHLVIQRFY